MVKLNQIRVCIKGAGEMASGIAWRLFQARFRNIVMLEVPAPLAVRRRVSFCEAVHDGRQQVEGVIAQRVDSSDEITAAWQAGQIAVRVDPRWQTLDEIDFQVVIDATLAKRNLGTSMDEGELVIGVGPGFRAPQDVHLVIETHRGHHLGRIIAEGAAAPNTGVPGEMAGYTVERVLRAPVDGPFRVQAQIGDPISRGQIVANVGDTPLTASIDGVLRGLIRSDTQVTAGVKVGDIDPRGDLAYCDTISEKARAIGGAVLEAVLRKFNL